MSDWIFSGLIEEMSKLIGGLLITIVVCSFLFGGAGYYFGNRNGRLNGYEQGAKDALSGKISWQQTIKKDSVLIIKK